MDWRQMIVDSYGNVGRILERVLDGLSQDELDEQPKPECNSIGWLTWHLTRWQDRSVAELTGTEQLWIKDKWNEKFNRPADPEDTGLGHTPEDLKAFKSPDVQTLLGYHNEVLKRMKSYLSGLSETDLGRDLGNPRVPTVGARLTGILGDSLQHTGQVAYVKGLLKS